MKKDKVNGIALMGTDNFVGRVHRMGFPAVRGNGQKVRHIVFTRPALIPCRLGALEAVNWRGSRARARANGIGAELVQTREKELEGKLEGQEQGNWCGARCSSGGIVRELREGAAFPSAL